MVQDTPTFENHFWAKKVSYPVITAHVGTTHLLAHGLPVPVLDAGVAQGADEWHVDLELLQLRLDGRRGAHGALVVRVHKLFGQLVRRFPQSLHLGRKKTKV